MWLVAPIFVPELKRRQFQGYKKCTSVTLDVQGWVADPTSPPRLTSWESTYWEAMRVAPADGSEHEASTRETMMEEPA
jgi:hypothetical protein